MILIIVIFATLCIASIGWFITEQNPLVIYAIIITACITGYGVNYEITAHKIENYEYVYDIVTTKHQGITFKEPTTIKVYKTKYKISVAPDKYEIDAVNKNCNPD